VVRQTREATASMSPRVVVMPSCPDRHRLHEGGRHRGVWSFPAHLHGLRFHDLRHTCASLSVAAGAHVKQVQARLGHASVQITLDRYTHLFPSAEEALAEKLDAIFHAPVESAASNITALAR
jgi:integrase